MLKCSLGIMAHNEEKNIAKTINAAIKQKIASGLIQEIIVVASGCTDNTVNIVKNNFLPKRPYFKLLVQENRYNRSTRHLHKSGK